jgi:colanic acid biosynthesis protein WcaH
MNIEPCLYREILKVMPIPCVDIIAIDADRNVLLLRRMNEPAVGQWWFPGGRVLFNEKRVDAAKRKLKEECGLVANKFEEVGTYDLFFNINAGVTIHSITTLFKVEIALGSSIQIDSQSDEARLFSSLELLDLNLSSFIYNGIMTCISGIDAANKK